MLDDPTGYGRIVRNARGAIQKIVEQKDATRAQLRIREGNSGILAAPGQTTARLARQAAERQRTGRVLPDRCHRHGGQGGNQGDAADRAAVAEVARDQRQGPARGARGTASRRTRARADAGGRDAGGSGAHRRARRGQRRARRVHRRQRAVRRQGHARRRCAIGPNVVLRNMGVEAGTVIHPNCVLEQSTMWPRQLDRAVRALSGRIRRRVARCTSATSSKSRKPRSPTAARRIT